jgi:glucosyl-3-phosphoglycerate synthase
VETYHNDAVMNGLDFDVHGEERAVELFAENIMKAGEAFMDRPMERPFIPSWSRVSSAMPEALDRLIDAVEQDAEEYVSGRTD